MEGVWVVIIRLKANSVRFGLTSQLGLSVTTKNIEQVGLSRATLKSQVKVFLLFLLDSKYRYAMVQ